MADPLLSCLQIGDTPCRHKAKTCAAAIASPCQPGFARPNCSCIFAFYARAERARPYWLATVPRAGGPWPWRRHRHRGHAPSGRRAAGPRGLPVGMPAAQAIGCGRMNLAERCATALRNTPRTAWHLPADRAQVPDVSAAWTRASLASPGAGQLVIGAQAQAFDTAARPTSPCKMGDLPGRQARPPDERHRPTAHPAGRRSVPVGPPVSGGPYALQHSLRTGRVQASAHFAPINNKAIQAKSGRVEGWCAPSPAAALA